MSGIRFLWLLLACLFVKTTTGSAQNTRPTVEQVRASLAKGVEQAARPLEAVFKTEVRNVWTGADSIAIRLYYPSAQPDLPIIYNIHGGAFVGGGGTDSNIARVLCNRTRSVVVSIDYRLAPEHPFPASIDDCYAVLNWIRQHARQIQGDDKKIMLLGDSAGGLFVGSLQVRQQQAGSPFRALALVFVNPAVDLRPTAAGADDYGLVVNWYLQGADPTNPLVSPILAKSFTNYPQSLIIVCEKDVLKPHGLLLASQLTQAGVATQVVDLPGLDHLAAYWGSAHPLAQPALEAVVRYIDAVTANSSK